MIWISLLLAWALGTLVAGVLWPRDRFLRGDAALLLALGSVFGLGVTSVIFFGASLFPTRPVVISAAVELAMVGGLSWRVRRRWREEPRTGHSSSVSWVEWGLAVIFIQAVVLAGVVAWRSYQAEPFGGWDGWAIWNLHARFMLRAGPEWTVGLNAAQLNWTHADYPWLVSASVARAWAWNGSEAPFVSALISVMFAGATVALLMATIAASRGWRAALLGGFVLLATPFFVTFAPNQHADIPLAACLLAAVVPIVLSARGPKAGYGWALAGVGAGLAAWTKNEGLLFVAVFALVVGVHLWRGRSASAAKCFFGALSIALLPVFYFKLQLAPANDVLSPTVIARLGHFLEPARHATILSSLWRDLGRFGEWQYAPWIGLALPILAWRARRRLTANETIIPVTITLMLAGYYAVYVVSPHDLTWHLDTSLVRLLLQVWPMFLLTWGLIVPVGPEIEGNARSVNSQWRARGIFLAANTVLAVALVSALASQRGVDELAVRKIGGAEISVRLGEGWFPLEKHSADEWAWSAGRATLVLHVDGQRASVPATLRFALSSVGERQVVIRQGDRVLWSGAVGGNRVPIALEGIVFAGGSSLIEFSTAQDPIAESPTAGGRMLAFALFNLQLD